jgi:hypothetical protein
VKDDNAALLVGLALMHLGVALIGGPLLLGHASLKSAGRVSGNVPARSSPSVPKARPNQLALAKLDRTTTEIKNINEKNDALRNVNNTAVAIIIKGNNEEAIAILVPLIKTTPYYLTARSNLAVAYNNLALQQKDNPRIALDSLWRAACLDSKNSQVKENIDEMLTLIGKDPNKFEDHLAIGDAQATEGCLYGAFAEYRASLAIRNDAQVAQKLAEIKKQAAKSGDDDINGAFFVKIPMRDEAEKKRAASAHDVNVGPYLCKLAKSMQKHWIWSKKGPHAKIDVRFTVARDGTLSNPMVCKSSGDPATDQGCRDAVISTAKGEPIPAEWALSESSLDLHFTFVQNVLYKKGRSYSVVSWI